MIKLDSFYHNQANLPHFSGHYGQRGISFCALALVLGRVALPLAQNSAAKKIGKELLLQAAPELIEIATKKVPSRHLKLPSETKIKKQVGGGSRS